MLLVAGLAASAACGGGNSDGDSAGESGSADGAGDDGVPLPDLGDDRDPPLPPTACREVDIGDFHPTEARFLPGQAVELGATLTARGAEDCRAQLELRVLDLAEVLHEEQRTVALMPDSPTEVTFVWDAPDTDFRGYLATLSAESRDDVLSTGIDVSSTPVRYPRYSYVSVFPPGQTRAESAAIVDELTDRFHLNMFQLYDWFWRHEDLIPRDEGGAIRPTWVDLFGRENAWATIRDLVEAMHERNAWAMGYVAIYGAREGYEQLSGVSPAWGLYETPFAQAQVALAFGGDRYLFLFDPTNPQWQRRMADEYVDAIEAGGFDGVHIDQFGPRPTYFRADGTPVELFQTFAPFLEAIDAQLEARAPSGDACVFNLVEGAVDGYGVEEVATTAACDFLYSEIWFQTDTYEALRAYIEQLREIGRQRAVVLAVYPQYGEDVGTILQAEDASLFGVDVDTDQLDYTGTGFVDGFDAPGDAITWNVDLSEDAAVSFVFRYSNATSETATRTLVIDGEAVGTLAFRTVGSWNDWLFDAWLQRRLEAGAYEVSLVYTETDVGAVNIDRMTLGELDEDSVRLQNAVIFASGATPIQIGDDLQTLSHEYFPNRSRTLRPSLQRALGRQYSFITANERLLFSPEVVPVPERLEVVERIDGGPGLVADGVGGIWTLVRSTPVGDAIHLVNLVGIDNERWRDAAPTPTPQTDILLRYRVDDPAAVREVLWATPDQDGGSLAFSAIDFTRGEGWVEFRVPSLSYWDVVLVRS